MPLIAPMAAPSWPVAGRLALPRFVNAAVGDADRGIAGAGGEVDHAQVDGLAGLKAAAADDGGFPGRVAILVGRQGGRGHDAAFEGLQVQMATWLFPGPAEAEP